MIVNTETLKPITAHEIRTAHPDISFPPTIEIEQLDGLGYAEYEMDDMPDLAPGERAEPGDIRKEGERYVREWVVIAPIPPSEEEKRAGVLEERYRRLSEGFEFDFGDERGVHFIQTRDIDEEGWRQVDRWAAAATGLGDTGSTLLISTGTGPVHVTAPEWHAIVAHGSTVQQPIWQASFALRAMEPVPDDYTDNKWWP